MQISEALLACRRVSYAFKSGHGFHRVHTSQVHTPSAQSAARNLSNDKLTCYNKLTCHYKSGLQFTGPSTAQEGCQLEAFTCQVQQPPGEQFIRCLPSFQLFGKHSPQCYHNTTSCLLTAESSSCQAITRDQHITGR